MDAAAGAFLAAALAVGPVADERAVDVAGFGAPFVVEDADLVAVLAEAVEALLTFLLPAATVLCAAAGEAGVFSRGGDFNGLFAFDDAPA